MTSFHPEKPRVFNLLMENGEPSAPVPDQRFSYQEPLSYVFGQRYFWEFGVKLLPYLKHSQDPGLQEIFSQLQVGFQRYLRSIKTLVRISKKSSWYEVCRKADQAYATHLSAPVAALQDRLKHKDHEQQPMVSLQRIGESRVGGVVEQSEFLQLLVQAGILETAQQPGSSFDTFEAAGRSWAALDTQLISLTSDGVANSEAMGVYLSALGCHAIMDPDSDFFTIARHDNAGIRAIDKYNWPSTLDALGWSESSGQEFLGYLKLTREQVKKIMLGKAVVLSSEASFADQGFPSKYPHHYLSISYFVDFDTQEASLLKVDLQVINVNHPVKKDESPYVVFFDQSVQQASRGSDVQGGESQLVFRLDSVNYSDGSPVFENDTTSYALPLRLAMSDLQGSLVAPHIIDRGLAPNSTDTVTVPFPLKQKNR